MGSLFLQHNNTALTGIYSCTISSTQCRIGCIPCQTKHYCKPGPDSTSLLGRRNIYTGLESQFCVVWQYFPYLQFYCLHFLECFKQAICLTQWDNYTMTSRHLICVSSAICGPSAVSFSRFSSTFENRQVAIVWHLISGHTNRENHIKSSVWWKTRKSTVKSIVMKELTFLLLSLYLINR